MIQEYSIISTGIDTADSTLHLLSFVRLPGAKLTSIDIAINKAYTAAGHRVGTHNYRDAVWPGGVAYGINLSNGGRFMVIGGGIPVLLEDGSCIGAVGCSTGTPDQDRQCAQAGVDAIIQYMREQGSKAKL